MKTQTTYQIAVTCYYYGPTKTHSRYIDEETGHVWEGTLAEAKALIAELDDSTYYLSHNESGRPDYKPTRHLLFF